MSDLVQKDKQYVWHPFTQHHTAVDPLMIVRAEGSILYDDKENTYVDANSSWWVNTHGHAHPHIGEAINRQFKQIDHIVFAGVTHPKAVELSERICNALPEHFQKVFFSLRSCNSASPSPESIRPQALLQDFSFSDRSR